MIPVFSLVLDRDVDENLALLYPELYKELTLGKTLSCKTFFVWVIVSVYQGRRIFVFISHLMLGCVIMILSNILIGIQQNQRLISVSFTALVLNELVMIALEINTWHRYMIYSEIATFAFYFISIPFLGEYFGIRPPGIHALTCRFALYHHVLIYLEDSCHFIDKFGTTLDIKGVKKADQTS